MNWADLRNAWSRLFTSSKPQPAPTPPPVVDTIPARHVPRGIRNNNPGNIRGTGPDGQPLAKWKGQVALDRDGFCIFTTPEDGLRALALLMLIYQQRHGLMTLNGLITRWAPPKGNDGRVENNTVAYIAAVCMACGVRQDDRVYLARDHLMLSNLTRAIVQHENGRQPYPPSLIDAGVQMALQDAP